MLNKIWLTPTVLLGRSQPLSRNLTPGINGGGAFGNSNWTGPVLGNTGDFDFSGGLFGSTVGANYQTGLWVFGVEGDWDWTCIGVRTDWYAARLAVRQPRRANC